MYVRSAMLAVLLLAPAACTDDPFCQAPASFDKRTVEFDGPFHIVEKQTLIGGCNCCNDISFDLYFRCPVPDSARRMQVKLVSTNSDFPLLLGFRYSTRFGCRGKTCDYKCTPTPEVRKTRWVRGVYGHEWKTLDVQDYRIATATKDSSR